MIITLQSSDLVESRIYKGFHQQILYSSDRKSMFYPKTLSGLPVRRILTTALHNLDEFLCHQPACLLTRMQFVEPQIRIRARTGDASIVVNVFALIDPARGVGRFRPVEVFTWALVYVVELSPHISSTRMERRFHSDVPNSKHHTEQTWHLGTWFRFSLQKQFGI